MPSDAMIDTRSLAESRAGIPHFPRANPVAVAICEGYGPPVFNAVTVPTALVTNIKNAIAELRAIAEDVNRSDVAKINAQVVVIDKARVAINKLNDREAECRAELARLRLPAKFVTKADAATVAVMRWHVDALQAMPRIQAHEALSKAADRLVQGSGDYEDRQMVEAILSAPRSLRETIIGPLPQSAERLRIATDPERARAAAWAEWAADLADIAITQTMHWLNTQRHAIGAPTAQQSR